MRTAASVQAGGPFDRKWGALPVALCLDAESTDSDSLRDLIIAGEDGVWALASRNVAPALKSQLNEIHALEKTCSAAK